MGWFTKLLGFAAIVGAAFLTFGGSLAAAGAWLSSGSIGAMVARTVLTIGISKLIANRAGTKAAGGDAPSARFQLRPSTTNKIPLIYGSGYFGAVMTDAIISTDNKTMWYVMACAEVTDTGTISFGNMYLDNRLITFDGVDQTKVVSFTNNVDPPQVDTNIAGNMFVYKYSNGSSSGVNTAQTAIQVLQDAAIPVDRRWTNYDLMTNTAFVIVKLIFNSDKQVTQLGEVKLNMINSLTKPGAVFLDYMQNTRYGCAIPDTQIDLTSLTALDTYSDELITYTPVGGGSATQVRYRINGPIDLSSNCLSNLQELADACDSWIQYSELTGKWKVVINKPYTGLLSSLYSVDSSVLIGGIDVTPIDLNQTFNSVEIQYPSNPIKDQTDVRVIDLTDPATDWYNPALLSPNEANNRLTIQYNVVNNYVQGVYLGVRRLLQSREDLTITCNLDYSGIQIEAGDVVRVTLEEYGWTDKLFRVSTVTEVKQPDGNLGASIVAFEYNDTIYNDQAIQNYVPEDNTGLDDPNIFDQPSTPIVTNGAVANGSINYYSVASNVPAMGTTLFLDFNIGNSSNVQTHKSYSSVAVGDGTPYTANSTITINVADSSPGTYYWSTTARNLQAGRQSNSSNAFIWVGPSVSTYNPTTNVGGVGYVNINPTASPEERMLVVAFGIPNVGGNTVTMPVQANANVILNDPIYLDGITLDANYYYPYYQNTSTTANGYLATSTSSFQPAGASYQILDNGDDNWYIFIYDNFSATASYPLDPTEYFKLELNATFIANADSVIQLGAFYTANNTGTLIYHDTIIDGTYILPANVPIEINFAQAYEGSANNLTDGGGFIFKNIIGNTRVTTLYNKLELYKGRIS